MVLSALAGVVFTVAALRATIYRQFSAGIGLDKIFGMIGADLNGLLRITGISLFGSLVGGIACVIAAPEGIETLRQTVADDTTIWCAAIDPGMNEQKYIVPGFGDCGDLCYGEKL